MESVVAQSIGGIAFLIGLMAFWQKDDTRFRYQMMAFCFTIGIHFVLMGAMVAAVGAIINGIRGYVSIKTQSRKVMWLFIVLMWAMTLPNVTHFVELMTVIGSSVATWGLFSRQGITLRFLILFNSFCWATHNIWLGSIGGSLVESCFVLINLLTIYRLYKEKKTGSSLQSCKESN